MELKKLLKKMAKLEKKFEQADGKPVLQARLLKQAASVEKKLEFYKRTSARSLNEKSEEDIETAE